MEFISLVQLKTGSANRSVYIVQESPGFFIRILTPFDNFL